MKYETEKEKNLRRIYREMHQSWKDAVAKLDQDVNYRNLFYKALVNQVLIH